MGRYGRRQREKILVGLTVHATFSFEFGSGFAILTFCV